jgi:hypothetical protein
MMHKLIFVVVLPPLALLACAAQNASRAVTAEPAGPDEIIVCTEEKPTGSNIVKQVCRSQATIDEERAEAEQFVQRMMAPHASRR